MSNHHFVSQAQALLAKLARARFSWPITHANALEAIAAIHGCRDWNTLAQSANDSVPLKRKAKRLRGMLNRFPGSDLLSEAHAIEIVSQLDEDSTHTDTPDPSPKSPLIEGGQTFLPPYERARALRLAIASALSEFADRTTLLDKPVSSVLKRITKFAKYETIPLVRIDAHNTPGYNDFVEASGDVHSKVHSAMLHGFSNRRSYRESTAPLALEIAKGVAEYGASKIWNLFERAPGPNGWRIESEFEGTPDFWPTETAHNEQGAKGAWAARTRQITDGDHELRGTFFPSGDPEDGRLIYVTGELLRGNALVGRFRGDLVVPGRGYIHSPRDFYMTCESRGDATTLGFSFAHQFKDNWPFSAERIVFLLHDWETKHGVSEHILLELMLRLLRKSYRALTAVVADITPVSLSRHLPLGFITADKGRMRNELVTRAEALDALIDVEVFAVLPTSELSSFHDNVLLMSFRDQGTKQLNELLAQLIVPTESLPPECLAFRF